MSSTGAEEALDGRLPQEGIMQRCFALALGPPGWKRGSAWAGRTNEYRARGRAEVGERQLRRGKMKWIPLKVIFSINLKKREQRYCKVLPHPAPHSCMLRAQ